MSDKKSRMIKAKTVTRNITDIVKHSGPRGFGILEFEESDCAEPQYWVHHENSVAKILAGMAGTKGHGAS